MALGMILTTCLVVTDMKLIATTALLFLLAAGTAAAGDYYTRGFGDVTVLNASMGDDDSSYDLFGEN